MFLYLKLSTWLSFPISGKQGNFIKVKKTSPFIELNNFLSHSLNTSLFLSNFKMQGLILWILRVTAHGIASVRRLKATNSHWWLNEHVFLFQLKSFRTQNTLLIDWTVSFITKHMISLSSIKRFFQLVLFKTILVIWSNFLEMMLKHYVFHNHRKGSSSHPSTNSYSFLFFSTSQTSPIMGHNISNILS